MKKIAIGLMVATLTVALSLSVMAGENKVWELDELGSILNYWEPSDPNALAKAWQEGSKQGECNAKNWPIEVTVHASVAQWIKFSLIGTRYDWKVLKPGIYAANNVQAHLQSNSNVGINFSGFENLKSIENPSGTDIEVWYAYHEDEVTPAQLQWISPVDLNAMTVPIPDDANLHNPGYEWNLWNKIKVTECNSACEYQDDAIITLVLQNQKIWVDDDGNWNLPQ